MKIIELLTLSGTLLLVVQNIIPVDCDASTSDAEIRKLKTEINPGCISFFGPNSTCHTWTNISLIHVRGDSSKDSLHFIWSFNGSPSLILALTPLDSQLTVNWNAFLTQNTSDTDPVIAFNGSQPFYTFGWSISNVWIFDDPSDVVYINKVNQSRVFSYHTKDFLWERNANLSEVSDSVAKLIFVSTNYNGHSLGPDGFLKIAVTVRNAAGYGDVLPFMIHNSNNSQVEIDFNKVQMEYPNPNFAAARVGFGLTLVQPRESKNDSDVMRIEEVKTLDDEHTPGVFELFRIRTPTLGPSLDQSYLGWKAICYTDFVRDIANSVDVHSYTLSNQTTFNSTKEAVNSSILVLYYGSKNFSDTQEQLLIQYANITFGTGGDGWYNHTPNLAWTFMAGYGVPPNDYVSLLVILVMGVGLGVPALLILAAGIYLFMKRLAKPRDDLLLER